MFNIAPVEKAWFSEKLLFKMVIVMVKHNEIKHKKIQCQSKLVNQNQNCALHEVNKSNATRRF